MKTLFIETDSSVDTDHLKTLSRLFEQDYTKFDEVITNASRRGEELIEAIKRADAIFVDSALVYNPMGDGAALFNAMMYNAIKLGIEGKHIHFFRSYDDVRWHDLRKHLVDKAFKKNFLYVEVYDNNKYSWEQVDIDKLLKELDD